MTPQMLHATLSTGQITIWEDRLDVTPKMPQQMLDWLRREEGLRACSFEELDREMQYRLLSHQDRCREMELPQPGLRRLPLLCAAAWAKDGVPL